MSSTSEAAKEKLRNLRERARLILAGSTYLRWLSFAFAIGSVALAIALTVLELMNISGAAYYRSGLFAIHLILSSVVIGAWVDREPLDIKIAIGLGIAAFIVDMYAAVWETARSIQCKNASPITAVDQNICNGEPTKFYINTIFAWLFAIGALIQVIVNFSWLGRINAAMAAKVNCGVVEVQMRFGARAAHPRMLQIGQKTALHLKAQTITEYHLGASWIALVHKVIGVIGTAIFVAVTLMEMFDMLEVAFYRSVLLLLAAFSIGTSLSAFGAVPTYWPWMILLSAIVGGVFAIYAMIIEIGRQARCGAPVGVYEQTICSTSGWQGYIVPVEASIVSLLMLMSIVFSIWSLVTARRLRIMNKTSVATQ